MPEFTLYVITTEPSNISDVHHLVLMPPKKMVFEVREDKLRANVTQLLPGEDYSLSVVAVSEVSGIRASSSSSTLIFAFTNTTGNFPLPVCKSSQAAWLLFTIN